MLKYNNKRIPLIWCPTSTGETNNITVTKKYNRERERDKVLNKCLILKKKVCIIPFTLEFYERLTKPSILILKGRRAIFASEQLTLG